MFAFLLIVQSVIAISLISVILMQRSEGGGLGVGGSSSGFMTARGAADFLTRATSVLGGLHRPLGRDGRLCGRIAPAHQNRHVARGQVGSSSAAVAARTGSPAPAQKTAPQPDQNAPAVPLAQ